MESVISCENLTLGYGREIVLENVSLQIPRGIFLPFVGPNGAGKTTFLRSVLGFLKPVNGRILTPFDHAPAGYVPQHKAIDPLFPMTVRDIVEMGLYPRMRWRRKPSVDEKKEVDDVLEEMHLAASAQKNCRDLSGGMKQKTLIARALVSRAEVLIMDEPTSELDEESEKEVLDHLLHFVQKQNKTVLIAHHGLNHLMIRNYAEQICLVKHKTLKLVKISELRENE